MTGRTSPRRSWKRTRLILAGVALLALVLGPSAVNRTEAGWHDEKKLAGSFDAGIVPSPTLTKMCAYKPRLLGGSVEIYWHLPSDYELRDVDIEASTRGLGSVLAPITGYSLALNTTSTGDGNYTTEVPAGLLTGLLGGLSELEVALFVKHESGWRSEPAAIASNAGLLGTGSCRNLTS